MAMTVHDILMNADAFKRAYPDWPHPAPEEKTTTPVIPRISRGSLIRLPDGRITVAVMVSDDGKWFRSAGGRAYFASEAEVVPLPPASGTEAAA